jgi:hypothetical protein
MRSKIIPFMSIVAFENCVRFENNGSGNFNTRVINVVKRRRGVIDAK